MSHSKEGVPQPEELDKIQREMVPERQIEVDQAREEVLGARDALKKEGISADLYFTWNTGGFKGVVGEINDQEVIIPVLSGQAIIGGTEINKSTTESLRIKLDRAILSKESGVSCPPKDMQIYALEYELKRNKNQLEVEKNSAKIGWSLGIPGPSEGDLERIQRRVKTLEEQIRKFKKSKTEDFQEFEKESR